MESNLVGSDEHNIQGETTFRWLPGGFFLEQRAHIDFIGQQIDALELIGYDPQTDTFPSTVFSGFSPTPLPYRWDVHDDGVTITVAYAAGRHLHRFLARGRHLRGRLAPQPRRRRERERPLRHRRAPSRITHEQKQRAGMKMRRVDMGWRRPLTVSSGCATIQEGRLLRSISPEVSTLPVLYWLIPVPRTAVLLGGQTVESEPISPYPWLGRRR
jgi:hypothetical protein